MLRSRNLLFALLIGLAGLCSSCAGGGGTQMASAPTPTPVPGSHSVSLSWNSGGPPTTGYYVYRGLQSGGPYTRLNASPQASTTFTDATVQSGAAYFYVTTAVDSNLVESTFSNEATAMVPTP